MCAENRFDTIVIGSGIGGLGAAAALAKCGQRVLVLERHFELGGLTQTFRRGDYQFATGVHYLGGVGEEPGDQNKVGRLLRWLTDERLCFTSVGSPYDIVRLPGLEFPIESPLDRFIARLKERFPAEASAIDRYFATCVAAQRTTSALFAARAMPRPIAALVGWLNSRGALSTTTAEALAHFRDRRLAALLAARSTLYGMPPDRAPIALHALVTGSYFNGAAYPVGGPAMFAKTLGDTVVAAGGVLRRRAEVERILVEGGRAQGVRLRKGKVFEAKHVISAMGAHNTLAALDSDVAGKWRREIVSLESGVSYVTLYLGFRGDIAALGASAANVWIYESDDVGRIWEHPGDEDPPSLFVSFPSLKDSAHADPQHHTAEIIVLCRWEPFSAWADSEPGDRPNAYHQLKQRITERLWSGFERHFPELVPLVDVHELSTPLTQFSFVAADRGAMYGLEMSAARMRNRALDVRTPVPGLLLAGQDAVSPGIAGAFMGGFMAAAALEPRLWAKLRS